MYDGEGSLSIHKPGKRHLVGRGIQLSIAQRDGPVLERLKSALREHHHDIGISGAGGTGSEPVRTLRINGGFIGAMRFAGEFGPTRLLEKVSTMWEGRGVRRGQSYELATVTSIEPVGVQPVSILTTSTGTFITGGYLTHNCTLVLNSLPYQWRLRYNDDTDMCLQVLSAGWCTILMNIFLAKKIRTMMISGGNTTDLYQGDGRLVMARSLERMWPGVVTTRRRFQRPQHFIFDAWKRFDTPLRFKPGLNTDNVPPIADDMELVQVKPIRSPRIQALYEAWRQKKL